MKGVKAEDFFNHLEVSQRTKKNYITSINSSFVKDVLQKMCATNDLFSITDLNKLWEVYSYINLHPVNVATHRAHSTVIMKYIRFLNNGQKYGRRIDYQRPRIKKNKEQ